MVSKYAMKVDLSSYDTEAAFCPATYTGVEIYS